MCKPTNVLFCVRAFRLSNWVFSLQLICYVIFLSALIYPKLIFAQHLSSSVLVFVF